MNFEKNTILPYTSINEHLDSCMAWIDECLSIYNKQISDSISLQSLKVTQNHLLARQEASLGTCLPLVRLYHMLSMTDFEYFSLLLALAPELNLKYEYTYTSLQGCPSLIHPTLGLARSLYSFIQPFTLAQLERITDGSSPLNRCCFEQDAPDTSDGINLHQNLILKRTTLRCILGYSGASGLAGLTKVYLSRADVSDLICYPEQSRTLELALTAAEKNTRACTVFLLSGETGAGRKYLLSQILRRNGRINEVLSVDMRALCLMEKEQFQQALETLSLEALLWKRFIHLDHAELTSSDDTNCLRRIMEQLSENCPVLLLSAGDKKIADLTDLPIIYIPFSTPKAENCAELWKSLGTNYRFNPDVDLESFGRRYRLTPGQITRILKEAAQIAALDSIPITRSLLESTISQNQVLFFGSLASRIEKKYTLEDLQIDTDQKKLLRSACSRLKLKYQVENQWGFGEKSAYGLGLSILFYGPPGTGKTMAAQVIAQESGLDLYRVDLSQIFSKYIGETEKNIGSVFQEAKKADIILFFDEADSLFSKRTDVLNANDRHSNAEISYLLQKMEEYDGVTILSTNLYRNFDSAFLRRLTYTIHFDMPDEKTRLRLWQSMIPDCAPISQSIDWTLLAKRFELSGSAIKSILRGAAYLAAEEGNDIQAKHIIQSMKYEFLKIGRMISAEEFGEYGVYL